MKTLKKTALGVAVAASLGMASTTVLAEDGLSANVAYVSDYIWRGDSQTNNRPTVQGGFDYAIGGFSMGTWASGVDTAGTEFDVYGSYAIGPVSIGLIYYYYDGFAAGASGAYEVNVGAGFGPVSMMISYDPQSTNYYAEVGAEFELAKNFTMNGHIGYEGTNADASIGVGYSVAGLDLGASYAYKAYAVNPTGAFALTVSKSL